MTAAITDTMASGVVVPRDTMVAPMTILGKPVRRANCTTPSTIQSAPLDSTATQTTMMAASIHADWPARASCRAFSSISRRR